MRVFRNQRNGRYYAITVTTDLFGVAVIRRWWGSSTSRRGGESTERAEVDSAQLDVERTARLRIRHGYIEVPGLLLDKQA